MRVPLLANFQHLKRKRAFRNENADIARVWSVGQKPLPRPQSAMPPLSATALAQWNETGVLILRGFFTADAVAAYKSHIDTLWHTRQRADNPLVFFGTGAGRLFRDARDEERERTYRLLDHYMTDEPTRSLAMDPRLLAILQQLMGHAPVVCNSLLFEWGSEQDMHSDMFYMAPASEDQMVASWIALDDVTEDNGPLAYVPGSHKIPPHIFSNGRVNAVIPEVAGAAAAMMEKIRKAGLSEDHFLAQSGDVLVWHSRLAHGGSAIRDRTARRTSLVTHYFSTRDVPAGDHLCAERKDGGLLLVKDHLHVS